MPRQAIRQGACTECDESDDNFTVTGKEVDIEENTVGYTVRCTCGETGTVTLDPNGTTASDNISHEDAAWNKEESDE
jgi:hypothetical protein